MKHARSRPPGSATTASTTCSTTSRPKARAANVQRQKDALAELPKEVDFDKLSRRRADRLRDPPRLADADRLAGREHQPVRGRPAGLQRVHHRQRLPAPHAIDRREVEGRPGRGVADRAHPERRPGGEGEPEEPAEGASSRRPSSRTAGRSPSTRRASSSWPARRRQSSELAGPCQRGRRGAEGVSEVPRRGAAAAGRRATGGSARRSSPRSWNWNSTPG